MLMILLHYHLLKVYSSYMSLKKNLNILCKVGCMWTNGTITKISRKTLIVTIITFTKASKCIWTYFSFLFWNYFYNIRKVYIRRKNKWIRLWILFLLSLSVFFTKQFYILRIWYFLDCNSDITNLTSRSYIYPTIKYVSMRI